MDVATALTIIKRHFGDEYDVIILDTDLYAYIYEAEMDIIRQAGSNDKNINVQSNLFPSAVPDSIKIKRVSCNGSDVTYTTRDELDLMGAGDTTTTTGFPEYWYLFNKSIYLYPSPTGTPFSVNLTYSKTPTLMAGAPASNTFTVPEVFHNDIIQYCLSRCYSKNSDTNNEQRAMDLYDKNLATRRDEAQTASLALYKIPDPDDFVY